MKKDNAGIVRKRQLRRAALRAVQGEVVVCETHAGNGRLFLDCYSDVVRGIAIEKNPEKTSVLARQRPTWRVAEGDTIALLAGGLGADLPITLLDVDPWGDPWPTLEALFSRERCWAPVLQVVVTDGLRQHIQRRGAWGNSLEAIAPRFGHDIQGHYLELCEVMLGEIAERAGYRLTAWAGYYTGHCGQMTHYWASLSRSTA